MRKSEESEGSSLQFEKLHDAHTSGVEPRTRSRRQGTVRVPVQNGDGKRAAHDILPGQKHASQRRARIGRRVVSDVSAVAEIYNVRVPVERFRASPKQLHGEGIATDLHVIRPRIPGVRVRVRVRVRVQGSGFRVQG